MFPTTDSLPDTLNRLRKYIDEVPRLIGTLSADALTEHRPGKWSKQQVLGHLIDSAIHNLTRFAEASYAREPYLIKPYQQDQLVVANQYQALPIDHLVTLWCSLNTQIIYIITHLSPHLLQHPVQLSPTNFEYKTLEWLVIDYVTHLEHHLKSFDVR